HLEIEHYPCMTLVALEKIESTAVARWKLSDSLIIHRYGALAVGAPIMMVATAAPHRGDAFAAAEFLMDYLKSRAPFWKKEVTGRGARWVAATAADEAALKRW
ncbi:MAG: molybdenum cofactor biosynthesis protein MoaE, partial [Paracoccaceae bacterium]